MALSRLSSSRTGLTSAIAAERLRRDGPNTIEPSAGAGILRLILRQIESPLVLILIIAALLLLSTASVAMAADSPGLSYVQGAGAAGGSSRGAACYIA